MLFRAGLFRMRALLAAVMLAVLGALLWSGPAAAHSVLVSSDPAEGAVLPTAPTTMTLNFSDGIKNEGAFKPEVTLQIGDAAATALEAEVAGNTLIVKAAPNESSGPVRWTVNYRIVSVDGHPVSGKVAFQVGEGTLPDEPAPAEAKDSGPGWPIFAGIGGVALILALGALMMWRRSTSGEQPGPSTEQAVAEPSDTQQADTKQADGGRTPEQ